MKLKLYTDKSHYIPEMRSAYLTGILKALWNDHTPEKRREIYGARADLFELVDSPEDSDVCLLPMTWNYYLNHNRIEQARQFAQRAQQAGKEIIVWSEGDYGVRVPIDNAVLFQLTINRSQRARREYALPPFFADNVTLYRDGKPQFRQKAARPIVGFCGQAASPLLKLIAWRLRSLKHWAMYRMGREKYLSPPIHPPIALRSRVLKLLSQSRSIDANFVIRDRYRGGVSPAMEQANPHETVKQDFIDNLDASDYIVCVRGTGNWSKRFYETLNWGRIPIFVDTDCILPFDFAVDWKRYCVWVERHELPFIAEKVADFHAALSPDDFRDLQQACRQLWLDRLSIDGFHTHFAEHFCAKRT